VQAKGPAPNGVSAGYSLRLSALCRESEFSLAAACGASSAFAMLGVIESQKETADSVEPAAKTFGYYERRWKRRPTLTERIVCNDT
jgi:hypothetical protein